MPSAVETALQQARDACVEEKEKMAKDLHDVRQHLKHTLVDKEQLLKDKNQLLKDNEQLVKDKKKLDDRVQELETQPAVPPAPAVDPPSRAAWFVFGAIAGVLLGVFLVAPLVFGTH